MDASGRWSMVSGLSPLVAGAFTWEGAAERPSSVVDTTLTGSREDFGSRVAETAGSIPADLGALHVDLLTALQPGERLVAGRVSATRGGAEASCADATPR